MKLKSVVTDNSIKFYAKASLAFDEEKIELKDKMLFALIYLRNLQLPVRIAKSLNVESETAPYYLRIYKRI